jgi:hypothetical protein
MKNSKNSTLTVTHYFQKQWAESINSQIPKHQNWLGDNWIYVADWSDNYGLEDWFFECSFSYSDAVMWEQINHLRSTRQKF